MGAITTGLTVDPYAWDKRVAAWEVVSATAAFRAMRDRICELAEPSADDLVVDLGAGTGLLALALAPRVAEVVAVDISEGMLDKLSEAAARSGIDTIALVHADLRRLPLEDESATLVVSNYAFHHLDDAGKELALAEAWRILRPGGRLVVCDMMFSLSLDKRDRRLILAKVWELAKRGPAGLLRIVRNVARLVAGSWEQPATAEVWEQMLLAQSFDDVRIELFEHEGGIAVARRPSLRSRVAPARDLRVGASGR